MTELMKITYGTPLAGNTCPTRITLKSAGPSLSDITVNIEVEPAHMFHSFIWSFVATYEANGVSLRLGTGEHAVGTPNYVISNATRCWGNRLQLRVDLKLHGGNNPAPFYCNIPVFGENPTEAELKAKLNSSALLALTKTLSGAKMFDETGAPFFKEGGFGLFLLTNPDMAIAFDWKRQCEKAATIFNDHLNYWRQLAAKLRSEDPKYKKLEDLTEDQVVVAALQTWKGGNYWIPVQRGILFKKYVWSKNPDVSQTEFGDRCMGNYQ